MKALLIEFNDRTGARAGNISPKNPNLPCYGWQDLDSVPAKEIRVVIDNNTTPYEGIKGVTILYYNAEINTEIDKLPTRESIDDPTLFNLDIGQRKIKIKDLEGDTKQIIKHLGSLGVKGIKRQLRQHIEDAFPEV